MYAFSREASANLTPVSWFSGKGLRQAANEGRGDLMPCYYNDMPRLYDEYQEIDAFYACVSPMDSHGYFSTGVTSSYSEVLLRKAKCIYLEVNENMPRSLYSPMIHISQVTALCENKAPCPSCRPLSSTRSAERSAAT